MADDFTQANRRLRIETPLGPDALLITALSGTEGISTLFHFQAELIGRDEDLDFDAIVGKNVTISIQASHGDRYLNGIVSRFSQAGTVGDHASYRAEIVPWLWLLTRTSDCRIFQKKSVPDIVQEIFQEYGFADFELPPGNYDKWDYCVQYRETDYNFIARLLEEEGISFYFDHENGKHTLVLADKTLAHEAVEHPDGGVLRFQYDVGHGVEEDVVTWFGKDQEVRAGRYEHRDYNMVLPSLDLSGSASGEDDTTWELYDYAVGGSPDGGLKRERMERLARIRRDEENASRVTCRGGSYCRFLTPGYQFTLKSQRTGAPSAFDGKYVLTSVHHTASESYGSGGGASGGVSYQNQFDCTPIAVPFHPPRHTPKPVINGVQTAVVVGPDGEEIYVDKYGQVKVQFHWDREGKQKERKENSSCWVRVSQGWAGNNWGMVTIPRIGEEVVVSFLEGDPDCPLITGRVYNGERMPPYELPANKTQSGIKSRSSLKGESKHFNEIRFEDKKGSEQIVIHAERDLNTTVEASESRDVGASRTTTIEKDDTETVKKGNHKLTVNEGDRNCDILKGKDVLFVQQGNIEHSAPAGTGRLDSKDIAYTATSSVKITCGSSVIEMGPASLKLSCGAATIEMNPALIDIKAPMVKINS